MKTAHHRVLARDMPGVIQTATGLPLPFIRQVIIALKKGRRIGVGRPISPTTTPRDVARIVLALSASSLGLAGDAEWRVGRLHLFAGAGKETAETELLDLIETAAGWHEPKIDFRHGSLLIGQTVPMLDIRGQDFAGAPVICTYRSTEDRPELAQSFFLLPLSALRKIARDLLPTENPEHD
ncbi:hypothetical protein [Phyllobacterium bourgognense]|uniref:Uncharacterized protein n=1 Tax=Phyllobacterium bourgognense TaxID=314236 RepID=A0A368YL78_9HYPH|nr:hypothetical protein [Phyllobacterium bourgognense]RCW80925.1 hypothetical protein C7476_11281 [Phyllobacterium bourgognense]